MSAPPNPTAISVGALKIVKYGDSSTHMDLSETSKAAKARHDEAVLRIETEKLARKMAVPVDVREICLRLRLLGEPITIFGETAPDRRERLRMVLARMSLSGTLDAFNAKLSPDTGTSNGAAAALHALPTGDQPAFRVQGPESLAKHRNIIAADSLSRAQQRLARERALKQELCIDSHPPHPLTGRTITTGTGAHALPLHAAAARRRFARELLVRKETAKGLALAASQVVDTRAVSGIAFQPTEKDGATLATATWGGAVKLWNVPSSSLLATLDGHKDRVTDIRFHPRAFTPTPGAAYTSSALASRNSAQIITAGVDAVYLWPSHYSGMANHHSNRSNNSGHGLSVKTEDAGEGYYGSSHSAHSNQAGTAAADASDNEQEYDEDAYDSNGELKKHSAKALSGQGTYINGSNEDTYSDGVGAAPGVVMMNDGFQSAMGFSSGGLTAHPSRRLDATQATSCANSLRPCAALVGHTARACRAAWHPHGGYAVTTSFDSTWRLWDTTVGKEVLAQPGHLMGTYAVSIHPDGSLVCVGDMSGNARIWDLRSGLALSAFEAHAGAVTGCDFACDGFAVATASADHSVKLWDLRSRKTTYTLPAHNSVVSDVRFHPTDASFVLTSGYDGTAAVWSRSDRERVAVLKSTAGKVMRAEWSPDGAKVALAGWDCTWKVYEYDGDDLGDIMNAGNSDNDDDDADGDVKDEGAVSNNRVATMED